MSSELEKLLSSPTYQELVEKLAGVKVYVPKRKSGLSDWVKSDVRSGLSAEEIANKRHIAMSTAYKHIRNIKK